MGSRTVGREQLSPQMREVATRMGRRLAELREALGLTQKAVSARSGLSLSYVAMLERGERLPHLDALYAVAKVLRTSVESLLAKEDAAALESVERVRSFIHAYALTDAEVSRLLGVARLMFPRSPGESP